MFENDYNPYNEDVDTSKLDAKVEIVEDLLEYYKFKYDEKNHVWRRQDDTVSILVTIDTDIYEQQVSLKYNVVVDVEFEYDELSAYMNDIEKDIDDAREIIDDLENEIKEKFYDLED